VRNLWISDALWALKVKSCSVACQATMKWGQRYSYTLSLTWALDGVGCQRHVPAALPPEKRKKIPIVQEAGRVLEPIWAAPGKLAAPGSEPRTLQNGNESLYQLSYSDFLFVAAKKLKVSTRPSVAESRALLKRGLQLWLKCPRGRFCHFFEYCQISFSSGLKMNWTCIKSRFRNCCVQTQCPVVVG
jgi:hypothetical protein